MTAGLTAGVDRVAPLELSHRAAEIVGWCDLDPPSLRDLEKTLARDVDQICLASPGGAAVVVPRMGAAAVKLLAVDPLLRGRGIGASLLGAAEEWGRDAGWESLVIGPTPPLYLWPGVPLGLTSMESFLLGRGYRVTGLEVNQLVEVPAALPHGLARRAHPRELEDVAAFCMAHYPNWEAEARFSFDEVEPRCAVWEESGELLGFACWSVVREGWFGPMATRPDLRGGRSRRGIGTGTLAVALSGLAAEGRRTAEIAWSGPERFYMKVAGARTHRAYRIFRKSL